MLNLHVFGLQDGIFLLDYFTCLYCTFIFPCDFFFIIFILFFFNSKTTNSEEKPDILTEATISDRFEGNAPSLVTIATGSHTRAIRCAQNFLAFLSCIFFSFSFVLRFKFLFSHQPLSGPTCRCAWRTTPGPKQSPRSGCTCRVKAGRCTSRQRTSIWRWATWARDTDDTLHAETCYNINFILKEWEISTFLCENLNSFS